eukprot:TRINITY_DN102012_c0_g1_i1.p1 TRINITY_DN102012_c0_g1~~TRINITY_DN102012_c0_g1_i1.p1  ORF type:complete len:205 (+),score=35.24 TRINITY_DN102012_c0_g1_i1:136-750(+)
MCMPENVCRAIPSAHNWESETCEGRTASACLVLSDTVRMPSTTSYANSAAGAAGNICFEAGSVVGIVVGGVIGSFVGGALGWTAYLSPACGNGRDKDSSSSDFRLVPASASRDVAKEGALQTLGQQLSRHDRQQQQRSALRNAADIGGSAAARGAETGGQVSGFVAAVPGYLVGGMCGAVYGLCVDTYDYLSSAPRSEAAGKET